MSVRRSAKQSLFAAVSLAAALGVLSSCAGSTPPEAAKADAAPTDGALLDDSAKVGASDVSDSNAFAGLEASTAPKQADVAKTASSAPVEGDSFYNAAGGETMRFVAMALYSDRASAGRILEKNPDLKNGKKLSAGQKVYFDMANTRPEPRFLSKDLLGRYPDALAERLNAGFSEKGLSKTNVTLKRGETLQVLSQRLYGSHRYWTEIYLVNRDKIQNYDRVTPGLSLTVVQRNHTGLAKAEVAPQEAPRKVRQPKRAARPVPVQKAEVKPVPVVAPVEIIPPPKLEPVETIQPKPVASQPVDPIPDTTPPAPPPATAAEKAPPPPAPLAPLAPKPVEKAVVTPVAVDVQEPASSNSSLRRILYIVLILTIGGAAYYFTRTPKRPKVDMLDLNAEATARPKLPPKDTQKTNIG